MKKLLVFLTATLLLVIGLTACGADEKTATSTEKKSLVFARSGDSTSLDPISVTDGETFRVTHNIFETLLQYGEKDTTVQPGLAQSWEVSDNGLLYTFKLLENVQFHDGEPFNADAVIYNFNLWMNGNVQKYPYYRMFGGYKGDADHIIEEITAIDEYTIQFRLNQVQAPFLKNLAMVPFAISSPKAIEKWGDDYRQHPVGTGPFKFVEWKANDKITLEKYENYHVKDQPKLDQVIFRVIPDNTARLNALINKEVDMIDGVDPSQSNKVKDNKDLQLIERPSMNVGYLGFQTKQAPFDNVLVRQALSHAVDKNTLIKAFYNNQAEPAINPLPPSVSGYNDQIKDYPYDLNKAKELLKQAGLEKGFEMELWAMPVTRPYMPDAQKIAEALQASFAKINVKVNVKSVDWSTYLEMAKNGEFPTFLMGWTGANGDADNFLYSLLDSDSIGSNNYAQYQNKDVHQLLIAAQTELDEAKRNELYQQAQVLIHQDAPWIPLVHSKPLLAASTHVKNYIPHPTSTESFRNIDIE